MKKILLLGLTLLPIISSSQIIISDDFESYTAGELLAANSDVWTTWSGGIDAEDAYVSDEYSSSGLNSVNVKGYLGPTDLIFPFPNNYTSGLYEVYMKMYVVSGYGGYWNIQQTSTPGDGWMFEIYLDSQGGGFISAGGLNAATVNYTPDKWNEVVVRVDLDNDEAECFVNSNSVYSWQWSLGADGMGAENSLGGIDIYSYSADGTDADLYVDDITLTKVFGTASPQINTKPNMQLVPNPSYGAFSVVTKNLAPANYQLQLQDVYGRIISNEEVTNVSTFKKDFELNLTSGIYFVKLNDGTNSITKKLIVKH